MLILIITIISVTGSGIWAIYSQFSKENKEGKKGRAGFIAFIVITVLSIFLNVYQNIQKHQDSLKAIEKVNDDVQRQEHMISQLKDIALEVRRISYALNDIRITLKFYVAKTQPLFSRIHQSIFQTNSSSLSSLSLYGISTQPSLSLVIPRTSNGKITSYYIMDPRYKQFYPFPRSVIAISNSDSPGWVNQKFNPDSLEADVIFSSNEPVEEHLEYFPDKERYLLTYSFIPTPEFATGKIISYLDLPSKKFAISLENERFNGYELQEIELKNSLGYKKTISTEGKERADRPSVQFNDQLYYGEIK